MSEREGQAVLQLCGITRAFEQAGEPLQVLRGCSLAIHAGETVALIGPSGSGKSTLLHSAGLLEKPDAGQIIIGGQDAMKLDDGGRTALRRRTIGFVYQFHHLLPEFSALENIVLPQMIAGATRKAAERRARDLLDMTGLTPRANNRPGKLSGGEQQRVAIARALANNPQLLIADEPTGNLDPATAERVFEILQNLVQSQHLSLLMATHNHDLARKMGRVVEIRDGHLSEI
ncbi:MAG: ABC transporter ATP-binding protein [Alphaproteobacteria bacterium]|nr:ABC transporter ATP-binding protein [Alphaproteobacteria bacterium]